MGFLKLFVALLTVSALAQPAHAETNFLDLNLPDIQTIIGGTNVSPNDPIASSTVLIVGQEMSKDGPSTFICSGSIIDTDMVLTAAHCLGMQSNASLVVAFRTDVRGAGPVIRVKNAVRPKSFFEAVINQRVTDWNDIAVIQLAAPIPAGYTISKILPNRNMLRKGDTVTLAGYGMNVPLTPKDDSDSGSGVLRKVEQTVISDSFGATEFLVSLKGGRGACHGDSGGPAFVRSGLDYYLIGVASRMTESNRVANNGDVNDFSCSVEMVYGNVLAHAELIKLAVETLRK